MFILSYSNLILLRQLSIDGQQYREVQVNLVIDQFKNGCNIKNKGKIVRVLQLVQVVQLAQLVQLGQLVQLVQFLKVPVLNCLKVSYVIEFLTKV